MNSDIIIYIPTIIFGIIVLWGLLWGFIKGARKTFIDVIAMIFSFAVCAFFIISARSLLSNPDFISSTANELKNMGTINASTNIVTLEQLFQALMLSNNALDDYADLAILIIPFFEVILTLALFITSYFVIRLIVSFVFRIIGHLLFGPWRIKRRLEEEYDYESANDPDVDEKDFRYRKKHLLGMVIGSIKGFISAFILFIFIGGTYSSLVGQAPLTIEEYDETKNDGDQSNDILINNQNVTDYINAMRTYEEVGIGKILKNIKFNGTPISYYLYDLMTKSEVEYKGVKYKIQLREEMQNISNVLLEANDSGLLKKVLTDPNQFLNFENYSEKFYEDLYLLLDNSQLGRLAFINATNILYNQINSENAPEFLKTFAKFLTPELLIDERIDPVCEVKRLIETLRVSCENGLNPIIFVTANSSDEIIEKLANLPEEAVNNIINQATTSVYVTDILSNSVVTLANENENFKQYIDVDAINKIEWYEINPDGTIKLLEMRNTLDAIVAVYSTIDFTADDIPLAVINGLLSDEFSDKRIEAVASSQLFSSTINKVLTTIEIEGVKLKLPKNINWASTVDENGNSNHDGELYLIIQGLREIKGSDDLKSLNELDIDRIINLNKQGFETILNSNVLHYAVSDIFTVLSSNESLKDFLSIPASVYEVVESDNLISKNEIVNMIMSLQTLLGKTSENNISIDQIQGDLNNLSLEPLYDEIKRGIIFDSKILHASLTKILVDLNNKNGQIIVVSENLLNKDGEALLLKEEEIDYLFSGISQLEISNIGQLSQFDVNKILNLNKTQYEIIFSSQIITETSSKLILDLSEKDLKDILIIPATYLDVIPKDELLRCVYSIQTLLKTNENDEIIIDEINPNNLSFANLYDSEKCDIILDSKIVYATLNNQIIIQGANIVTIPQSAYDNNNDLGIEKVIYKDELKRLFATLQPLGIVKIDDFNNLDANKVINLNEQAINTIFKSLIVSSTATQLIRDLRETANLKDFIAIPSIYNNTETFVDTELTNFVVSIQTLLQPSDGSDIDINTINIDNISLSPLQNEVQFNKIMASNIIYLSLSNQVLNFETNKVIYIPDDAYEISEILITERVISKDELFGMFKAVEYLGVEDINSFNNISVNRIINLNKEVISNILVGSKIVHCTASNMVMNVAGDNTFVVVPNSCVENNLITVSELTTFVASIQNVLRGDTSEEIKIEDLNPNSISLVPFQDRARFDEIIESAILHATLSKQIISFAKTDVIVIPDESYILGNKELITTNEIFNLFTALEALEVTNMANFENVNINKIINLNETQTSQIFDSNIILYTASDMILNLTNTDQPFVIVPVKYINNNLIEKDEIIRFVASIQSLLPTQEGQIDINGLNASNITFDVLINQDSCLKVLASEIIYLSLNKQILGVDILEIPNDVLDVKDASLTSDDLIKKDELTRLFNVLNVVGINNIASFADLSINKVVNLDSEQLYNPIDNTGLFSSLIITATSSSFIKDLGVSTNGFIAIPSKFTNTYIDQEEQVNLIKAFQGIFANENGQVVVDNISAINFQVGKIEDSSIYNSKIIHLSISNQIKLSLKDSIITEIVTNLFENETLNDDVIDSSELINLAKAVKALSIDSLSAIKLEFESIMQLDQTVIEDMIESNIVLVYVGNEIVKLDSYGMINANDKCSSFLAFIENQQITYIIKDKVMNYVNQLS